MTGGQARAIRLILALALNLLAAGLPLFVILGLVTAASWGFGSDGITEFGSFTRLITPLESLLTKEEFLAIPLFMAAGAIMTKGGLAKRLIDIMMAALGWMPGGFAVAAVVACMFFAAISGSSPVTLIAVGSIMFPAMVAAKYPENFSLGIVMTAGSLGCLVPPAISMLIYSISVSSIKGSVEPSDMFLAGFVPALVITGALVVYAIFVGLKLKEKRPKFELRKLFAATAEGIWALALPVVILGGIYGGLFTPSRAGAVAVVYSLFVTMFIYREMTWKTVLDALAEAGKLMGMLILIIGLAFGLNEFLAFIEIDETLKRLVTEMNLGPVGFMVLVNVILIVLGALMDSISATLIFAPMLAPIAVQHFGIDPLHFGVVFVVNMEIGYLMPPVATNLFVAAATFKKPFGQVARAVLPTLGITVVALGVFMYVPTCSKGLINAQRGLAFWEDFPWDGVSVTEKEVDADGKVKVEEADLGDLSSKHADEILKEADLPTAAPDAGGTGGDAGAPPDPIDPMLKYKNQDDGDDFGTGGGTGGDNATTPTPDGGIGGDNATTPTPPKPSDPMDKYKKGADDDPFGTGAE